MPYTGKRYTFLCSLLRECTHSSKEKSGVSEDSCIPLGMGGLRMRMHAFAIYVTLDVFQETRGLLFRVALVIKRFLDRK